jgi:hypothetical protein
LYFQRRLCNIEAFIFVRMNGPHTFLIRRLNALARSHLVAAKRACSEKAEIPAELLIGWALLHIFQET